MIKQPKKHTPNASHYLLSPAQPRHNTDIHSLKPLQTVSSYNRLFLSLAATLVIMTTPQTSSLSSNQSGPSFLFILAAIQFTHILDFMIMMPQGPMFMRDFNIDTHAFGWLVSSYTLGAAAMGLLATLFIERQTTKRLLVWFYALFILATLACAIAPTYTLLAVARTFAGIFGGLLTPLVQTMVAENTPAHQRGSAMGVIMTSFSLATVAGVPLGLLIAHHSSWRMSFVLIAVVSLLIWVYGLKKLPSTPKQARTAQDNTPINALKHMWKVLIHPTHLVAYTMNIMVMMAGFTIIPFITIYMTHNVGFSESSLPLIYLCGGICTLISARVIGQASDRWGSPVTFRTVALLSLIPILAITHLSGFSNGVFGWSLVVTSLFFILISGRMIPMMALFSRIVDPNVRASFMSVNATMQHLGSSMAAILSGMMLSQAQNGELLNYHIVGYTAVGFTLLAITLSFRLTKHAKI